MKSKLLQLQNKAFYITKWSLIIMVWMAIGFALIWIVVVCSLAEIEQLQQIAKKHDLMIVPLVQTFGHFEVLFVCALFFHNSEMFLPVYFLFWTVIWSLLCFFLKFLIFECYVSFTVRFASLWQLWTKRLATDLRQNWRLWTLYCQLDFLVMICIFFVMSCRHVFFWQSFLKTTFWK